MKQGTRTRLQEATEQSRLKGATEKAKLDTERSAKEKTKQENEIRIKALKEAILIETSDFKTVLPNYLKSAFYGFSPFHATSEPINLAKYSSRTISNIVKRYSLMITRDVKVKVAVDITDENGRHAHEEIDIDKIEDIDVLEKLTIVELEKFEDEFDRAKHVYLY